MDVTAFRATFPEFGVTPGSGAYSDTRINFWLGIGAVLWSSERWGDLLDHGLALYIAHHLVLDDRAAKAAARGGDLGIVEGPRTQKGVDKVSAAYDTTAVTFENAQYYNSTTYGVQFYQLVRMFGSGGVQV